MHKIRNRKIRYLAVLSGGLSAGLYGLPGSAQDGFPTRTVTIVVPSEPGSGPDTLARIILEPMSKELGRTVIVENRAGAAGNIGASGVARSAADGYTLLMMATVHTIAPSVPPTPTYSPVDSFSPIGLMATSPLLAVGSGTAAFERLVDLFSEARKKPGAINYATPGKGSLQHLATEMLAQKTGVVMTHVPYKSGAAAAMSVASGETSFAFLSIPVAIPLLAGKKLKPLGLSAAAPSGAADGVPQISNVLNQDFKVENWFALVAPAGTPSYAIQKLNSALNVALKDARVRSQFKKAGVEAKPSTPVELGHLISTEVKNWSALVDAAKIKFND